MKQYRGMETRKIIAPTMQEALEEIRRQFGEDAVVVGSRTVKQDEGGLAGRDGVEVWVQEPAYMPNPEPLPPPPCETTAPPAPTEPAGVDAQLHQLAGQLQMVHAQLDALTANLHWSGMVPDSAGAPPLVAHALAQKLICSGGIARDEIPAIAAFIGPTGAGKTTAIAKLAWMLGRQGNSVGVITLDTRRVGAPEQARLLCGHLGVPLEVLYRPEQAPEALDRLTGCDVILIDTPGLGAADATLCEEIETFLTFLHPSEVHLVCSANIAVPALRLLLARAVAFEPDQMLLTKLDEGAGMHDIIPLMLQSGFALSYLCHGPSITGEIAVATHDRLTAWLARDEGDASWA